MINPDLSAENLAKFADPNRGRITGISKSKDGQTVRLFTGMGGRSEPSKNRKYILINDLGGNGPFVKTDVFDRSKPFGDAAATIYDAQRSFDNCHAASNGEQTGYIAAFMADAEKEKTGLYKGFERGQNRFTHEGPKNANTPRVSVAFANERGGVAYLGQILPDPEDPSNVAKSIRRIYVIGDMERPLFQRAGYFTATYDGQGETGANYEKPWAINMPGSLEDNMDLIWKAWDEKTRGNLCGKEIDIRTGAFRYAFRSIHPVEYDTKLLSFPDRLAA